MNKRAVLNKAVRGGKAIGHRYNDTAMSAYEFLVRNPNAIMFIVGTVLLTGGLIELSTAQIVNTAGDYQAGVNAGGGGFGVGGNPTQACSRVLGYIEGGFGALVATGAGLGAIVAAALGGFKAAWCLLVVSIGCFILRSYLTLFHAGCKAQ